MGTRTPSSPGRRTGDPSDLYDLARAGVRFLERREERGEHLDHDHADGSAHEHRSSEADGAHTHTAPAYAQAALTVLRRAELRSEATLLDAWDHERVVATWSAWLSGLRQVVLRR